MEDATPPHFGFRKSTFTLVYTNYQTDQVGTVDNGKTLKDGTVIIMLGL